MRKCRGIWQLDGCIGNRADCGRDAMKISALALLGLSATIALGCSAAEPPRQAAESVPQAAQTTVQAAPESRRTEPGFAPLGVTPCTPVDDIQFICDLASPEDLAVVPGFEWIIASGESLKVDAFSTRSTSARRRRRFSSRPRREPNGLTPRLTQPVPVLPSHDAFRAHGLYLKLRQGRVHTLGRRPSRHQGVD